MGDPVTFVVTVRNPNTATFGITITDQLAPLLTIVCGSEHVDPAAAVPVCDAQQNVITYIAPITAQTGLTLTFRAMISSTLLLDRDITNTVWVDDGERIISRTVTLDIASLSYVYLPLIARRWPPIPYPPTNVSVTAPDIRGDYTISWDYVDYPDVTAPASYELQESLDAAFSDPAVYLTTQTSYSFTDKPNGRYYYRLRGKNVHGDGVWANLPVVHVTRVFFDDFSDPTSGWRTKDAERYNFWDANHPGWEVVAKFNYIDDHYQIYVPHHRGSYTFGEVDTFWVWPVVEAPLPPEAYPLPDRYCIEARAAFVNEAWVARWGIVFGATTNLTYTQVYAFHVNDNANRAVIYYQNYLFPGNINWRHCVYQYNCEINKKIFFLPWYEAGHMNPVIFRAPEYNTLKVVVREQWVDSYVNGVLMDTRAITFPRERIGLIGGSWEVTPVDLRVDYFRYRPMCPEAQQ